MPELQHRLFEADDTYFAAPFLDKAQSVLVIECNPAALDPQLTRAKYFLN